MTSAHAGEIPEEEPPDDASDKGLAPPPRESPKDKTARDLAVPLFAGAGVIVVLLVAAATTTVIWKGTEQATALLAFFGAIVSALGTLLGGIVGYFYGQADQGKR